MATRCLGIVSSLFIASAAAHGVALADDSRDPVATLADDPRVAAGTLEVDAGDGSLLLRDAAGTALLRLPASSLEGAACGDPTALDEALERAVTAGSAVHLFRGESRELVVALDDEDLVLLEHDPDDRCWRSRSVFDADTLFRSERVLIEGRTSATDDDRHRDDPLLPGSATASVELDAAAPGEERIVLEGLALRFERADGSSLIEPLELVEGDRDLGSRLQWRVELGELADGRAALRIDYTRRDETQTVRDANLTHILAVEGGTLVPVLVYDVRDKYVLDADYSSGTVGAHRRDRDGRSWELASERSASGGSFPHHFVTIRSGAVCAIERYESSSSRSQRWQARVAGAASVLAERSEAHDDASETADCDQADLALLAAAEDLRNGLPETLVGTRFVYRVERFGGAYADEAAKQSYYVERTVTASGHLLDGSLELILEERGGADAAKRDVFWVLSRRCFTEAGAVGSLHACRDEEVRLDDDELAIELRDETSHESASWRAGTGPSLLELVDARRELRWTYELVGVRHADGRVEDEGDLEPLVCDWHASEKATGGAIELALSGKHAAATRLTVATADDGEGMRATLERDDGSVALALSSDTATLVRAKRWLDPAAGHELVLLQADGEAGVEVYVITLSGDALKSERHDFAAHGSDDFATLLIAGEQSCLVRVSRGKGEGSQVADFRPGAAGLERSGGSLGEE